MTNHPAAAMTMAEFLVLMGRAYGIETVNEKMKEGENGHKSS